MPDRPEGSDLARPTSWLGGGFVEHGFGFLIGQPPNQQVVVHGSSLCNRFAFILGQRRHLCLSLAEELPGFLDPILPEKSHGVEEMRDSLYFVVITHGLFGCRDTFFSRCELTVTIFGHAEAQLIIVAATSWFCRAPPLVVQG